MRTNSEARSSRFELIAWLIVAGAVLGFLWEARTKLPQTDDAFIAYRYARNFVDGYGLVFNPGERVEGFTSLAWVLLLAGGIKLGFDARQVAHALGIACGAALLCLSYSYARLGLPPHRNWIAALTPWLLWSTISFAYWTTAGLETPLACLTVLLVLFLLEKGRMKSAVGAAAAATLTRPEGALLFGLVVLVDVFPRSPGRRSVWVIPLLSVGFLAALTAFRLIYFGALLPNTFYAKVGTVPLWMTAAYAAGFVGSVLAPLALPFALGALGSPALRIGAAWVGVTFVYVLAEGSDYYGFYRYFLPSVAPFLAVAIQGAATAWGERGALLRVALASVPGAFAWYVWGPIPGVFGYASGALVTLLLPNDVAALARLAATATAVVIASSLALPLGRTTARPKSLWSSALFGQFFFTRRAELERVTAIDEAGVRMSLVTCSILRHRFPGAHTIAAEGIGAVGYCFRGNVLDLLGLTDRTIARTPFNPDLDRHAFSFPGHQRTNAAYVLSRRPDLILVPQRGAPELSLPAAVDLYSQPGFDSLYVWDRAVGVYRLRSLTQK